MEVGSECAGNCDFHFLYASRLFQQLASLLKFVKTRKRAGLLVIAASLLAINAREPSNDDVDVYRRIISLRSLSASF